MDSRKALGMPACLKCISKCCPSDTGSKYEPVTISCVWAQLQSCLFCLGVVNGAFASSLVTLFASPKHKYQIKLAVKMILNNQLGSVPSLLYHKGEKAKSQFLRKDTRQLICLCRLLLAVFY